MKIYKKLVAMDVGDEYQLSFIHHSRSLPINHRKNLQALILYYYFTEHDLSDNIAIPYGGSSLHADKGLLYNLNKLPPKLRKVLFAYVKCIKG